MRNTRWQQVWDGPQVRGAFLWTGVQTGTDWFPAASPFHVILSAPRVRPSLGVVHSLCGALGLVSELGQMVVGG